jgi:hypothetical protein
MQLKAIAGSKAQTRSTKEPKSLVKLRAILNDAGMRKKGPDESFANFEKRLHDQLQTVERDLVVVGHQDPRKSDRRVVAKGCLPAKFAMAVKPG